VKACTEGRARFTDAHLAGRNSYVICEHARIHPHYEPKVLPPEYAGDVGAKAILHAAACLPRDVYVGGASQAMPGFARRAPSLCDRNMSLIGVSSQTTRKAPSKRDGLTQAAGGLRERSRRPGRVLETGAYTRLRCNGIAASFS
jgi:hypothetical protein